MKRWLIRIAIAIGVVALVAGAVIWYIIPRPTLETDLIADDGIALHNYVFLPDGDGPWPTVLMRTPYPPRMMMGLFRPAKYTDAGYAFVMQSCRGTNESGGDFIPFSHALPDAQDTLDWLVEQDFCNGDIGLTGVSAMGITAHYAASLQHPAVKAAYVALAPQSSFDEGTFIGGVFLEAQVGEWMALQKAEELVDGYRARPIMDDEWKRVDLPAYTPKINIPIYHVGGWFDIFQNGVIENFAYLQENGEEGAKGNQKLRIGAFGHLPLEGDLTYPDIGAPAGPVSPEEIRWFDHWLKDVDNGITEEPNVEYYLMAAARSDDVSPNNTLVKADAWPPATEATRLYLHPSLLLSMSKPEGPAESTAYTFDPANPVPTVGGANLFLPRGPKDQREIPEREDYLRFETAVLEEDVTIAGRVQVELFAATDGPDTDFMAKLVDVYPDGYEAILLDAPIRARFRNGRDPDNVAMMPPGVPQKLVIDLWNTANVFEKGHKIALHITSSNAPRFEVNPNTGHTSGDSNFDIRVATNTIFHDATHPSALILPLVPTTADALAD